MGLYHSLLAHGIESQIGQWHDGNIRAFQTPTATIGICRTLKRLFENSVPMYVNARNT
jgi:hypothetical protein